MTIDTFERGPLGRALEHAQTVFPGAAYSSGGASMSWGAHLITFTQKANGIFSRWSTSRLESQGSKINNVLLRDENALIGWLSYIRAHTLQTLSAPWNRALNPTRWAPTFLALSPAITFGRLVCEIPARTFLESMAKDQPLPWDRSRAWKHEYFFPVHKYGQQIGAVAVKKLRPGVWKGGLKIGAPVGVFSVPVRKKFTLNVPTLDVDFQDEMEEALKRVHCIYLQESIKTVSGLLLDTDISWD